MVYLTRLMVKHNENCPDRLNVRRLYIKIYVPNEEHPKRGKQKLIPYGLACLSCNKIIREYGIKTAKQKEQELAIINKKRAQYGFSPLTQEGHEKVKQDNARYRLKRYIRRLEREELQQKKIILKSSRPIKKKKS
jgi:hypothetical protein